ncbi:hypothetical protein ACRRTK_018099 [Alexandromys fortis]
MSYLLLSVYTAYCASQVPTDVVSVCTGHEAKQVCVLGHTGVGKISFENGNEKHLSFSTVICFTACPVGQT